MIELERKTKDTTMILPDEFGGLWEAFIGPQSDFSARGADASPLVNQIQHLLTDFKRETTVQRELEGREFSVTFLRTGPFVFRSNVLNLNIEVTQADTHFGQILRKEPGGIFLVRQPGGNKLSCCEGQSERSYGLIFNDEMEHSLVRPKRAALLSGMFDMMYDVASLRFPRAAEPAVLSDYPKESGSVQSATFSFGISNEVNEPYL